MVLPVDEVASKVATAIYTRKFDVTVEHVKEVPEIVRHLSEEQQFVSRADMAKLLVGAEEDQLIENFMHSGLLDTSLEGKYFGYAFVAAPNERYDFKLADFCEHAEELVKSLRPEQDELDSGEVVTESAVATLDDYTLVGGLFDQPRPWHLWVMHLTAGRGFHFTASPRIRAIATDIENALNRITFIGSSIRRLGP
ncbi:hypothetical protein SPFM15_00168 [Salmonella phage SPFM15]|nr:hypothetical protein SPFM5_00163 [Salmonella phage SPFM5]VFR13792.1 hypothetical protein SPFM15_00168 [Salmonella phage SPFM15]